MESGISIIALNVTANGTLQGSEYFYDFGTFSNITSFSGAFELRPLNLKKMNFFFSMVKLSSGMTGGILMKTVI